ncbi:hypothetical protein L1987_32435 [Smallanthus sonchifolius]|uniref:Uncharacterized protein n=1 Tax=Smallanthus sonchifolius TaxID=185202 RepID=A0ACB9HMZ9_9ASTR|nr:hypothetical protein L1987_32435 [Smallanthus sonchifolius]
MERNHDVKCIIPSNELLQLQKLERIRVSNFWYVEKVFEVEAMEGTNSVIVKEEEEEEEKEKAALELISQGTNSVLQTVVKIPYLTQLELKGLKRLKYIWKSNPHQGTILEFPNLTTLSIELCKSLKHVFTSSMVSSLQQLQDLHVSCCENMEVIVKEEEEEESECDAKVKEIVTLPCLKSLKLEKLQSLKGFYLGKDDFSLPSLHTLEIMECPELTIFTTGYLDTPALNIIVTNFVMCYVKEDLNSFINTKLHEGFQF